MAWRKDKKPVAKRVRDYSPKKHAHSTPAHSEETKHRKDTEESCPREERVEETSNISETQRGAEKLSQAGNQNPVLEETADRLPQEKDKCRIEVESDAALKESESRSEERSSQSYESTGTNFLPPLLRIHGLSLQKKKVTYLKDIDIEIEKGSAVGIIGPTGAGKSLLLKAIFGTEEANAKTWEWEGQKCRHLKNRAISYFSSEDTVSTSHTLRELVQREIKKEGFSFGERAEENICVLRLPYDAPLHRLSPSERIAALFGVELAKERDLYLLDEPLGNTDIFLRDTLLAMMLQRLTEGATMVIAASNPREWEGIWNVFYGIHRGNLCLRGDMELFDTLYFDQWQKICQDRKPE